MKKTFVAAIALLASAAIGCDAISPSVTNSNKSMIDQAADAVFGTEKTGIAECDAILDEIERQMQQPNETTADNLKRQAVKQAIVSQIRGQTANANLSAQDRAAYGKRCREIAAPFLTPQNSPAPPAANKK